METNIIAFDIETYPNLDVIDKLPEVVADSRLKDEAKIQADIEKKKAEQIQKMALNPMYGKIACIGYYGADKKTQYVDLSDEKTMLANFMNKINDGNIFVGWNSNGFDLEFIIKRAIILGVEGYSLRTLEAMLDKRNPYNLDLMQKWCGYGKMAKLNEVANILIGEQKEDLDVTQISELIKTKSGKELLKRYCLQDCKLTYEIAKRCGY